MAVTALLVIAPLAGLVAAAWLVWGRGIGVADLLSAGFFYFLTGFGVTVGFHRLLTHRGFTATPALRAGLAVAGSMSFQGSAIAWVATRRHDRATNLWPLALLSMGESWHNTHHSDPTCARHGVDRGQIDLSAGVIRLFERLGWATDVRWSDPRRLAEHRIQPATPAPVHPRTDARVSRDQAG